MRTFTDQNGKTWIVIVNVATLRAVKEDTGEDLLALEKSLPNLMNDWAYLGDVLGAMCKSQIAAGNSLDAIYGDTLTTAADAIVAAICDFLPTARRESLNVIVAKVREAESKVLASIDSALSKFDVDDFVSRVMVSK